MLDDYDRSILAAVQRDNQITHAALGETVCLSASAVRRRLMSLRERGVIRADVSMVDPGDCLITVIVRVTFGQDRADGYREFGERMLAAPEVSQCYSVAGDVDFVLVVQAPDLPSFEAWGQRVLMSEPAIRRYDSNVVYTNVKFATALPMSVLEKL